MDQRTLRCASAVLVLSFLALTSEGLLCALPCAMTTAPPNVTEVHCQAAFGQSAVELVLTQAAAPCGGEHGRVAPAAERPSTRSGLTGAPETHAVSFNLYEPSDGDTTPAAPTRVDGSPPPVIAPLRI